MVFWVAGKRKKGYDKSVYRSFAMIMQFGINMLVPICMMSALGIYLDRRFDTSHWMVILFFAGAIAGGQNVYRMARQIYSPEGRQEDQTSKSSSKELQQKNDNN
ncbi:MAG: AtpZ/AtpI family protein [Lachnospiraceae bacterium]|nr:AtpZ/AtpI family protein [Lachnospiraceae bacterium]